MTDFSNVSSHPRCEVCRSVCGSEPGSSALSRDPVSCDGPEVATSSAEGFKEHNGVDPMARCGGVSTFDDSCVADNDVPKPLVPLTSHRKLVNEHACSTAILPRQISLDIEFAISMLSVVGTSQALTTHSLLLSLLVSSLSPMPCKEQVG